MTRRTTPPSGASVPPTAPAPLVLLAPVGVLPAPLVPPDLLTLMPWLLGAAALVLPPAFVLYRRIQRDTVLDTPARRQVLEAVRDHPGATVARLAEHVDLDYTTVRYHVNVLEEFDLVTPRRRGRNVRIYPPEGAPRRPAAIRKVPATALGLLQVVVREPGITQSEAARRLGVTRSTVHWHVERLEGQDLLETREGRPGLHPGRELAACREYILSQVVERPAA